MIYLDAAGLSKPEHEPFVVVAGVIIHPDKQWKALARYLSEMADEVVPPEHRVGFAFHAMELFSGGKIFQRDKYPKELRWQVLDELVSIPEKFDLPIVFGCIRRSQVGEYTLHRTGRPVKPVVGGQIISFILAAAMAEHWMNQRADVDEIASMVMENDDQSRAFIHTAHRMLSDPQISKAIAPEDGRLKVSRIISPIHFEEKTDSSALQVADVCAFAIKRRLMRTPESERFYKPLVPYLCARHKLLDDITAAGSRA